MKPKMKLKTRMLWQFRCRPRKNGFRRVPPYAVNPAFWARVFDGEIGTFFRWADL